MIRFGEAGSAVARTIENARLFCDDGLKFPQVILFELSPSGFAAAGSDGYAVGRDVLGETFGGAFVQVSDEDAEAIEKASRSLKRNRVDLALKDSELIWSDGEAERTFITTEPDERWPYLLDLLEPAEPAGILPGVIAFSPARLTRFGRVKTAAEAKGAPIDIRLEATADSIPIALFRIGPTFRGMLKAIDRRQAAANLGEEQSEGCFWEE